MKKAKLHNEIETAYELRREYLDAFLNPQYLSLQDLNLAANEISSLLLKLRSELDSGALEPGIVFHRECLKEIDNLNKQWPKNPKPPLHLFYGCMYDITNRCLHRFVRGA